MHLCVPVCVTYLYVFVCYMSTNAHAKACMWKSEDNFQRSVFPSTFWIP